MVALIVRLGTHYPHVTWAHMMLRARLRCERRFNIEFYGADSHFCHSAYVTWSHVELWSAQVPARLCRTHFVRREVTWPHVSRNVCDSGVLAREPTRAPREITWRKQHDRSVTLRHRLQCQIASHIPTARVTSHELTWCEDTVSRVLAVNAVVTSYDTLKRTPFWRTCFNVFRVFLTINADYLWDLRVLQRRCDCCVLTGDTVYTGWSVWTFRRIPLSVTGSAGSSETSIHFSQYTRRLLPDDKSHLNSIHWLPSSSKIKDFWDTTLFRLVNTGRFEGACCLHR
jgi:hypothetical protein